MELTEDNVLLAMYKQMMDNEEICLAHVKSMEESLISKNNSSRPKHTTVHTDLLKEAMRLLRAAVMLSEDNAILHTRLFEAMKVALIRPSEPVDNEGLTDYRVSTAGGRSQQEGPRGNFEESQLRAEDSRDWNGHGSPREERGQRSSAHPPRVHDERRHREHRRKHEE